MAMETNYEIQLDRKKNYHKMLEDIKKQINLVDMVEKTKTKILGLIIRHNKLTKIHVGTRNAGLERKGNRERR